MSVRMRAHKNVDDGTYHNIICSFKVSAIIAVCSDVGSDVVVVLSGCATATVALDAGLNEAR